MPRFTVLLPTHNRADVLPFAIRSALWQTAGDFELLIAGDGCTDGTADVVASFSDPRIRWFDLPKAPGIGYANRNVVLREARGQYVAYLSHDDLWFPDHLERLGARLDATGAEFAHSRLLSVDVSGRIKPSSYNLEIASHQAGLWRGDMAITITAVVHTRECLERYGYWNETLRNGGDIELWHRILANGRFRNLAFVSVPTALHFVAGWRRTSRDHTRMRMARWLHGGFFEAVLPAALRLPSDPRSPQQQAAWEYLAHDPLDNVAKIRRGVEQFQDALLWNAQSAPQFAGLRAGLALGRGLDALSRRLTWLTSAKRRRYRDFQQLTRELADRLHD